MALQAPYNDLHLMIEFDQSLSKRDDEDANPVGRINTLPPGEDNAHLTNPPQFERNLETGRIQDILRASQ